MKEEILEEGIFAKSLIYIYIYIYIYIHTYIYIYHIYICYIESIVIKENLFIERQPL